MKKNKPILILAASLLAGLLVSCGQGGENSSSSPLDSSSPTSSSSESREPEVKHSISLVQVDGVRISADKTEALKGETVTITLEYDAKSVTPTLVATPTVTFTPASTEGSYTFVMPDNDISVTATVETLTYKASVKYLTTSPSASEITYSYIVNGAEVDPNAIKAGAEVLLTASGFGSYELSNGRVYLYLGDEILSSDVNTDETSGTVSVSYTFVMPAGDTELILVQAGGAIAENDSTDAYAVSYVLPEAGFKAYGAKPGDKYTGSFSPIFVVEEGYLLEKCTYMSGDSVTPSDSYLYTNGNIKYTNLYAYSIAGDVTFTLTGEYKGVKTITYVGLDNILSIGGDEDYSLPSSVTVGEDISISSVVAVDGKYLSSITVVGEDNTEITSSSGTYIYLHFTMPNQNVTVTFITATIPVITWNANTNLEECFVSSSYSYSDAKENQLTSATPGSYLYAYVKPMSGYKATKLTITCNGIATEKELTSEYYNTDIYSCSFTMPEGGDITIDVTLSQVYTITVEASDLTGCTLEASSSSYGAGEQASVTIKTPDSFYKLTSIIATYNGEPHTWTEANKDYTLSGAYVYFTMPSANITLKGVFKETQAINFTVSISDSNVKKGSVRTGSTYSYYDATDSGTPIAGKAKAEESLNLTAQTDPDYYAKAVITYSDNTTETKLPSSLSVWSSYASCDFDSVSVSKSESAATVSKVEFVSVKREAVTATITNEYDTEVTLAYAINATTATSLDGLLAYDTLKFTLTKTDSAPSGYKYGIVVKDINGNELSPDSSGQYVVPGNITIKVTKSVTYTIQLSCNDGITFSYYYLYINGDFVSSYSVDSVELAIGDKVELTYFTLSVSSWTATITNGDKTLTYTSSQYDADHSSSTPYSFVVKGNVTITFAATSTTQQ